MVSVCPVLFCPHRVSIISPAVVSLSPRSTLSHVSVLKSEEN